MKQPYDQFTIERLRALYPFSKETLRWVAKRAGVQQEFATYAELFAYVGMPDVKLHIATNGDGVPYVDIPAKTKRQKGVLVLHASMGNPLDPNQLYQVAAIADTNPEYRVIAFGNPSGKPYYVAEQSLSFKKWWRIAFTKNRHPLVHAELDYLAVQGITSMIQIGFSYGALKAVIESYEAPAGSVERIVILDPASHPRNPVRLVRDFMRTYQPLGSYVNRVESKTFHEARGESAKLREYGKTYMRPVNMVIGLLLSRASIATLLQQAVARNPKAVVVAAWGSKSELTNDTTIETELRTALGNKTSLRTIRLKDQEHAFANDIYLYAAVIREALL